jgi:hypothetical protein
MVGYEFELLIFAHFYVNVFILELGLQNTGYSVQ